MKLSDAVNVVQQWSPQLGEAIAGGARSREVGLLALSACLVAALRGRTTDHERDSD